MMLQSSNVQNRDLRLLAHEYAHVVQHVSQWLNGPNYSLNSTVQAGLEGWAEAFALSYHFYRRDRSSVRPYDELSFTLDDQLIWADHTRPQGRYFGSIYPSDEEDNQDGKSEVFRKRKLFFRGFHAYPCRGKQPYVCGGILASLYWFVEHNAFMYASPHPLGAGSVSRGSPIWQSSQRPTGRGMLNTPVGHGASFDAILSNMVAYLDVETEPAPHPDRARLLELLRQFCLDLQGAPAANCAPVARLPEVLVPWASRTFSSFSDGLVNSEDWTGDPRSGATDEIREISGLEHLLSADQFIPLNGASVGTVYTDLSEDLTHIRLPSSGSRAEAPISLPAGFGAPAGPLRWTLRIATSIPNPTHSLHLSSSTAPRLRISLVDGTGTVVDSVVKEHPINWWPVPLGQTVRWSYPRGHGELRGWDNVSPELALNAPPGAYTLRVESLQGASWLYAVIVRRSCNGPDLNGNGVADDCDPNRCAANRDGDDACDAEDNCPLVANDGQRNADGDAYGDLCDACPMSAENDDPSDGTANDNDPNLFFDTDGDGWCDLYDNCPTVANRSQRDHDGDGDGDRCDPNDDNDAVVDSIDLCPQTPSSTPGSNHTDQDGNGIGDDCQCSLPECPVTDTCDFWCDYRSQMEDAQDVVNLLVAAIEELDLAPLHDDVPWHELTGCMFPDCPSPSPGDVAAVADDLMGSRDSPMISRPEFEGLVIQHLEALHPSGIEHWRVEAYLDDLISGTFRPPHEAFFP